jgi:hypothetical protein
MTITPEERARILDVFPPKGEDPDEWIMAYQLNQADGWAATASSIADHLPLAKFVLTTIREAVEGERENCAALVEDHSLDSNSCIADVIRAHGNPTPEAES